MENKPLSKRASAVANREAVIKLLKTLWRNSEGPFENLFRLLSYSSVVLPGGFLLIALDKISSYIFNFGIEDLGKFLDTKLGLGPGSNLTPGTMDKAAELIEGVSDKKAKANPYIIKKAGLLNFFLKGGLKTTFGFLWQVVKFLLTALAITNFGDIYNMSFEEHKPELENFINPLLEEKKDLNNETVNDKEDETSKLINSLQQKYK